MVRPEPVGPIPVAMLVVAMLVPLVVAPVPVARAPVVRVPVARVPVAVPVARAPVLAPVPVARAPVVPAGGIRRGMWTVGWYRDLVGLAPGPGEELLDAEAAQVPRGSGGLMAVLDWLAPTEAPFRGGALLGFDGTQHRGAVHRAILEGIALTMVEHLEAMESALGRSFSTLMVSGGGARAELMLQILAEVTGRPTRRTAVADGALLVSAICAAVGAGVHPGFEEAVAAMVTPGPLIHPDPAAVAQYAQVRAVYSGLRAFTDPLFRWVAGDQDPIRTRDGRGVGEA